MQDPASIGGDRHGHGIGNRVIHGEEFDAERAHLHLLAITDFVQVRRQPVLGRFRLQERQCQTTAVDRNVRTHPQEVGNRSDVVLVSVRENDCLDIFQAIGNRSEVRQDQVDARL